MLVRKCQEKKEKNLMTSPSPNMELFLEVFLCISPVQWMWLSLLHIIHYTGYCCLYVSMDGLPW